MIETAITSSVLIAIIIGIRFLFSGKISRRLQYALWGLVLLRLCLPFALFSSPMSVMNAFGAKAAAIEPNTQYAEANIIPQAAVNATVAGVQANESVISKENVRIKESLTVEQILRLVWIGGSIALGLWFAAANLRFYRAVIKTRQSYLIDCELPVYVAEGIASPCMFGLLRPSIYLTAKAVKNEESTRFALEHELCHYRHGDHIWSILRVLCLIAYWWNPLVWAAALLSKSDSEMACDEAVISRIGKDNRLSYGYVLVDMIAQRNGKAAGLCCVATTMVSGKRSIEGRLNMIVKNPKTFLPAMVAVLMIVAVCVIGTFTGAKAATVSASEALEKLAASVVNNGEQISFTIPEDYENTKDWNIHIAGRLVSDDGFSQSTHLMEVINDQRAWKAGGIYSIPMNTGYTELTLTAYLPDKNGKTLEKSIDLLKPGQASPQNDLDASVSEAILSSHKGNYKSGDFMAESHVTLKTVENESVVTVYAMVLYIQFEFSDGKLTEGSGGHMPAAITFERNAAGEYALKEYWIPKDGGLYLPSLREKFPADILDALDTQKYITAQTRACYAKAVEYAKIDTDAIIEKLFETICSSPAEASNPGAYIDAHSIDFRELSYYGEYTLMYVFSKFLKGGQTGLKGHIMLAAMREIIADELPEFGLENTAQAWFDAWKEYAISMQDKMSSDYMEKNYPNTYMMLILAEHNKQ